ncbi:MAG: hypothetical protein IPM23_15050 [Candidatus Melainabacteria bacterium]|nr:hypothetical protein [Candidatus Melainabacteria bacterium]
MSSEEKKEYPHFVVARINEYIQPIDRGDRYEDPLNDALEEKGLGEVTGGGTELSSEGRIDGVDLDIELADLDEALSLTRKTLVELGIPAGSRLTYTQNGEEKTEMIGDLEGLEIYLDAVGLPDEVYETLDFPAEYERLTAMLKNADGEPRCVYDLNEETLITAYGPDADRLFASIETVSNTIPVFQNARIVFKRRDPSKEPKERRLPMN